MNFGKLLRSARLLAAALLLVPGLALADATLDEAQALIKAGKAEQAYQLLAPLEGERAGDPDYDYLLGISAVDSGRPALGVFALERVLDQKPDHVGARAEIARAYFALGENDAAKEEFSKAKDMGAPSGVEATIDRYLSAIESRFEGARTRTRVFIEGTVGFDSNTNAATDRSAVLAPGLAGNPFIGAAGIVALNQNAREQKSTFGGLAGGITHTQPLRADLNWFAGLDFDIRSNTNAHIFDPMTVNGHLGLHWLKGRDQYRLMVQGQTFDIDTALNRRMLAVTGQMQRTLDQRNQITVYGQAALLRYPGQLRDVNEYLAGLAWGHALGGTGSPILFLSGYAGFDDERGNTPEREGREFFGGRVGLHYTISRDVAAFGAVAYQHSNYGGIQPVFLEKRIDNFWDYSLGFEVKPVRHWSLRPQVRYTKNNSSLPINDYTRGQLYVSVRREFE